MDDRPHRISQDDYGKVVTVTVTYTGRIMGVFPEDKSRPYSILVDGTKVERPSLKQAVIEFHSS